MAAINEHKQTLQPNYVYYRAYFFISRRSYRTCSVNGVEIMFQYSEMMKVCLQLKHERNRITFPDFITLATRKIIFFFSIKQKLGHLIIDFPFICHRDCEW